MSFMSIIPETPKNILRSETVFLNYLLIVDAYQKIPKLYGMKTITTEEVMNNLDMFQARFRKIEESSWWDLEIFSVDAGTQFTPM